MKDFCTTNERFLHEGMLRNKVMAERCVEFAVLEQREEEAKKPEYGGDGPSGEVAMKNATKRRGEEKEQ